MESFCLDENARMPGSPAVVAPDMLGQRKPDWIKQVPKKSSKTICELLVISGWLDILLG